MKKILGFLVSSFLLLICFNALAALPTKISPSSIVPTILNSNSGVTANRLSETADIEPSVERVPELITEIQQPTLTGGDNIHFVLKKIIFSGNTVFSCQQLQKIIYPYLNRKITIAQLQELTQKITNCYHHAGYVLSRAVLPAQNIENGIVRIQILEGFIDQVSVCGGPGKAVSLLQKYGQRIAACHPLHIKTLERYLLLANDIPGECVKAVITPSEITPGAAHLSLVTTHKIADLAISYDNYSTLFLGPREFTGIGSLNSFITPGDRNTVRVVISENPRLLNFYEFTRVQPLNSNGLNLILGANYTKTNPGDILSPLFMDGKTYILFGSLSDSLIRSRTKNLTIFTGVNYQNTFSNILDTPFYDDRIRALEAGFSFDNMDRWNGANTVFFKASQGFNILGATNAGTASRPEGQSDFTKLYLELTRTQCLNSYFSFYLAGKGQYAFNPLLASEQFTFGGPPYGRGYDPAILLGDQGIAGKAELRLDTHPSFCDLKNIQYYIFYDAGAIWNYHTPGLPTSANATAAGIGARLCLNHYLSGDFFVATPVTKPNPDDIALGENANGARAFFQLWASI